MTLTIGTMTPSMDRAHNHAVVTAFRRGMEGERSDAFTQRIAAKEVTDMNRNRSPISNTIRNGVRRGPLLVVIPTSTEAASDVSRALEAVREAAERPATGDVVVVVSVEGREDSPEAYSALCEAMAVLRTPAHVRVYVTGTSEQGGGVAIERALAFMDTLVEMGVWTAPYARVTVTNRGSNVRELRLSAPPRTVVAQPVLVRAA